MHAYSLLSPCSQILELNNISNRWKEKPMCFPYCDYMCADLGMCMAHVCMHVHLICMCILHIPLTLGHVHGTCVHA